MIYEALREIVVRAARASGVSIMRAHRVPRSTLNLLEFGLCALRDRQQITFLQIGVSDGRAHDPLRVAERDGRFKGILVEPQFAEAEIDVNKTSRIKRVRCVVGDQDGDCTFYTVRPGQPLRSRQKSSLSKEHLGRHGIADKDILPVRIPMKKASTLLRQLGLDRLDLLVCDAEGADWKIVRQLFDDGVCPVVLFFEVIHLCGSERSQMRCRFDQLGYGWCETLTDVLAVRRGALAGEGLCPAVGLACAV